VSFENSASVSKPRAPVPESARIRLRVLAFARLRELLASEELTLELADGARISDVWQLLADAHGAIAQLRSSTRFARNGRIVSFEEPLADGDELALLPPVGGG
jgi:molybdopterin converting factor small subunit